jgi:uncharacterized peroxidase-related enzyme
MPYINLPKDLPGIRGPLAFRPETAKYLNDLAEVLLRSDNSLTRGERELIATYVSSLNDCFFCQHAHGSLAQYYLQHDSNFIDRVNLDYASSELSPKLKSLLAIAGSVQKGGRHVTAEQIRNAKEAGASEREIHDTVLVAAAFCMFNRYVGSTGTWMALAPGHQRTDNFILTAPLRVLMKVTPITTQETDLCRTLPYLKDCPAFEDHCQFTLMSQGH